MQEKTYDYIVIGAGYGGLAAAALLAKQGYKVCILEAHGKPGGCASFFKRDGVMINAGATTISGFGEGKPIHKLCSELGILEKARDILEKQELGMIVNIDGKELRRYADSKAWKEEAKRFFKLSDKESCIFDEIERIDSLSWKLLAQNKKLLPINLLELFDLLKPSNLSLNLKAISLIPGFFISFNKFIKKYKLNQNKDFMRFADEQLLITTQSHSNKAPYLSAALGLAYPSEVYYPKESIVSLAKLIEESFIKNGGTILYRQKVESINYDSEIYELRTNPERAKRSSAEITQFRAKNIISNSPIWNTYEFSPKPIQKKLKKYNQEKNLWGAYMLYFTCRGKLDAESYYYQIHTDSEIPHCKSKSFFLSILKIEEDLYSITISTHTPTKIWLEAETSNYETMKEELADFIMNELYLKYPIYKELEIINQTTGTPKSFEHYTQRKNGYVGGIPHTVDKPLFLMPSNKVTDSFYLVGDTSFPGQGIAAVIYSALSLSERI